MVDSVPDQGGEDVRATGATDTGRNVARRAAERLVRRPLEVSVGEHGA